MLSVAAYCVSRLICARPRGRTTERDVDTVHCAEGVAMAGMLVLQVGSLFLPCVRAVSWRGSTRAAPDTPCGDRGAESCCEGALGGDAVRADVAGQDLGENG